MSKSNSRKRREKLVREGRTDVTLRRGSWGELNPVSGQTKSKKELLSKMDKKYRKNLSHDDYLEKGSFSILIENKVFQRN